MTIPELQSHPQYLARENFIEWKTEEGKTCVGPNVVPKFKKRPGKVWRATPSRGLDTADILSDLGYSEQQIKDLENKNIVKLSTSKK